MKFRDGMWFVNEGMKVEYATEVSTENTEIRNDGRTLHLLCPTRQVRNRMDAIDVSALTLDISASSPGIIAIEATHWAGAQDLGPHFDLYPHGQPEVIPSIDHGDHHVTLCSGDLSCKVNTAPNGFGIQFFGQGRDEQLTSFDFRSLGFAYSNPPTQTRTLAHSLDHIGRFMLAQLALGVGEKVYGLGEQFTEFIKNGQRVRIFNENGGTSSEQAYKTVPFYLTNRGYGVFVDHSELVDFEVGSERSARCQFSVEGQRLKFYIINGPSPKDIFARYTTLTGRPPLPPAWSFGLWLSTSFTTDWTEKSIHEFLTKMEQVDCPVHVLHIDSFWMRRFRFCDFTFNPAICASSPKKMIADLKSRFNVHVCVWINAYIAQESPLFAEAACAGYLIRRRSGDVWQWDYWQPGMGIVDFTNPDACAWYASHLHALVDLGIDSFKTDFGEDVPWVDAVFHDGSDPKKMHSYFATLYNRTVFGVLKERFGEGKACVFARSATAGGQTLPVHWSGDSESTPVAMAETLRGGLSLATSGFGYWSHDIGGFEGLPPANLYKRWVAFGLLSTHSRLHGSETYRVPWNYDEEASAVLGAFTRLKCRLMPYLYAMAVDNAKSGVPILRPMFVDFEQDPVTWFLDRQYLLGGDLLVAPVFEESGKVQYYLPKGRWTRWFDSEDGGTAGETVQGPLWLSERYGFMGLPLFVKEGAILVLGKEGQSRVDYDYLAELEIRLYHVGDKEERILVDVEGKEMGRITVDGGKIEVPEVVKSCTVVDQGGKIWLSR